MLGALEVKAITRFAAQHGSAWKPLHTAVLGCLLAHRNRRTGRCFPERHLLAAHCNVSERTIDRILDQLTAWGALERQQPRALSSQQFRGAQYVFLFELPRQLPDACESPSENPSEKREKSCADSGSRATNFGRAVRQNAEEPCDKNSRAVRQNRGLNKEEEKDLEVKVPIQSEKGGSDDAPPNELFQVVASPELQTMHDEFWAEKDEEEWAQEIIADCRRRGLSSLDTFLELERTDPRLAKYAPPADREKPQYTQQDFDERDWRKLNRELDLVREARVGVGSSGEENFRYACQRAGINVRRGYELWKKMMSEEETG